MDPTDTNDWYECMDLDKEIQQTPEFPNNWCHLEDTDASEPFKMTITCSKLLLVFKDSASATHGTAEVFVDGRRVLDADPYARCTILKT